MKLRDNENLFVLGIFLGMTGLISALVLALTFQLTAKPVEEAKKAVAAAALQQVISGFDNDPDAKVLTIQDPELGDIRIRAAKKSGKVIGYAVDSETHRGYAGKIKMLAGFNPDWTIRAILITEQKETPGLGAELCKRQFKKTIFNLFEPTPDGLPPNDFLDQFNNKKLSGKWQITKDGGNVIYVTGATVTSRAVADLAWRTASVCKANAAKITTFFGENK